MQAIRIRPLNSASSNQEGKSVLYVMSRDQRAHDNHALLAAQKRAIQSELPLIVFFNLLPATGFRSQEHYKFMLDGLEEVASELDKYNIAFVLRCGSAQKNVSQIAKEVEPESVFFDFSPLHGPRKIRQSFAKKAAAPCYEVDTHNIIPAWVASDHQEFAAHTMRSKVHKLLPTYLQEPESLTKHPYSPPNSISSSTKDDITKLVGAVPKNHSNLRFISGEKAAKKHLQEFIANSLTTYALERNEPAKDSLSNLSPYLHYGQISSLRVALDVIKATGKEPLLFRESRLSQSGGEPSSEDGMNALLEEMIVRKELSDNFCYYAKNYTDFSSVPTWAITTLNEHKNDAREFIYSRKQWEAAETHDPAWNAAQNQLLQTGKIHGYMRMYWAKKMLEWSNSPEQALKDCIYLNDTYSVDGGDPNGYVGILWAIAGLHDRPWTERPVFGKIRYMNYSGLKRKFDIERYIATWNKQTSLI